jgi:hypothetical protein
MPAVAVLSASAAVAVGWSASQLCWLLLLLLLLHGVDAATAAAAAEMACLGKAMNKPVKLQLVLLPPLAADITDDTPPDDVILLQHGVSIRGNDPEDRRPLRLSGLPLKYSVPCKHNWYLRGE